MTNDYLATLELQRVIFHDVPKHSRAKDAAPTLSETETVIDGPRRQLLKERLVGAVGSKHAYPVVFTPATPSPVPPGVRAHTVGAPNLDSFVAMSRAMAMHLFESQNGAMSAGLLCVIQATARKKPAVLVMKLEREAGAQLELTEQEGGKKTFDMSVLQNLVLTEGTRLFKSAMFVRTGPEEDDFLAVACDGQLNVATSDDVAKFWLRFLGCQFTVQPRIATQRFYEAALRFISESIEDPVTKNDVYEHLQSQLKSNRATFSPKKFIEDYVPGALRRAFRNHLEASDVALVGFRKDSADIDSRLKRFQLRTQRGAIVTVPADEAGIVTVEDERIIVEDRVSVVGSK